MTDGGDRIAVRGLGKRYGSLQVFQDVNLTVGAREIVALVGPSGCGKTTMLRVIDGLIPATEGEVLIEGERVTEPRAGVAMVFQHFGLFPWKTVAQNVAYGLRLAGTPADQLREQVPRFIRLVGLTGFENAYPYQLSGGMQQRCGLARALALEPSVLLMDEPFASVDAQTREILQFELLRLWQMRPTTMLFVTHSIEEAIQLSDRILLMSARPSVIREEIPVPLPRPRSMESLTSDVAKDIERRIWAALMQDVSAGGIDAA